ncbi:XRE family transcriptional regulator [Streptomyces sp. WAC 00631]|uniref:helix-turn-helix domain-containing protein n=1 Tax=Streptomyces sp. WAC 00631 TaxID=2203201 RepID=UPI001C8B669B|nr:ImmA/IrrE family metallo-endopeptidase [Streptomyces sp. WAC 00631]MCC5036453.1 XRE family transcriptional regulator [Streptomyces sp. WAC 00631]
MSSISDRVRNLIERSGLSLHDFADQADLDAEQFSECVSGASPFSTVDLAVVADEFHVSMDWLLTGAEPPLAVAARTTTGKAAEALAAARDYVARRADLDKLGYPQPWTPVSPTASSGGTYAAQGEMLAELARRAVERQGRLVNQGGLPELIEAVFGADVAVEPLGDGFDGLAAMGQGAKLILLGTASNPARQRFTLAHELGHLLADDDQDVHLDRDIFDRAQKTDPSEQRANAFASVFLLPEQTLREAVGAVRLTRESFATLCCDFMVSPATLAYRLLKLRVIDAGACDHYKRMTVREAAEVADRVEELDRQVAASEEKRLPGLLVRDTRAAYEAGKATLRPYASLLGVDVDELRDQFASEQDNGGAL